MNWVIRAKQNLVVSLNHVCVVPWRCSFWSGTRWVRKWKIGRATWADIVFYLIHFVFVNIKQLFLVYRIPYTMFPLLFDESTRAFIPFTPAIQSSTHEDVAWCEEVCVLLFESIICWTVKHSHFMYLIFAQVCTQIIINAIIIVGDVVNDHFRRGSFFLFFF